MKLGVITDIHNNHTALKVVVETIDVEYDVNSVIDAIDRINYPEADNIKKYFYGIGKEGSL